MLSTTLAKIGLAWISSSDCVASTTAALRLRIVRSQSLSRWQKSGSDNMNQASST
jgi:hypothetical protein